MFIREETYMTETEINVERVRQVAIDGLMVLGMLILLAVELPL
jgi:predicted amino acid-binding ACT domain protein